MDSGIQYTNEYLQITPYKIKIGNDIKIYTRKRTGISDDYRLLKVFNIKDTIILKSNRCALINLHDNIYVYIGHIMYTFKSPEPITQFITMLGGKAPYSIGRGKKYTYYLSHMRYGKEINNIERRSSDEIIKLGFANRSCIEHEVPRIDGMDIFGLKDVNVIHYIAPQNQICEGVQRHNTFRS